MPPLLFGSLISCGRQLEAAHLRDAHAAVLIAAASKPKPSRKQPQGPPTPWSPIIRRVAPRPRRNQSPTPTEDEPLCEETSNNGEELCAHRGSPQAIYTEGFTARNISLRIRIAVQQCPVSVDWIEHYDDLSSAPKVKSSQMMRDRLFTLASAVMSLAHALLCEPIYAPNLGHEDRDTHTGFFFAVVHEDWKGAVTSKKTRARMLDTYPSASTFEAQTWSRFRELWNLDCGQSHHHPQSMANVPLPTSKIPSPGPLGSLPTEDARQREAAFKKRLLRNFALNKPEPVPTIAEGATKLFTTFLGVTPSDVAERMEAALRHESQAPMESLDNLRARVAENIEEVLASGSFSSAYMVTPTMAELAGGFNDHAHTRCTGFLTGWPASPEDDAMIHDGVMPSFLAQSAARSSAMKGDMVARMLAKTFRCLIHAHFAANLCYAAVAVDSKIDGGVGIQATCVAREHSLESVTQRQIIDDLLEGDSPKAYPLREISPQEEMYQSYTWHSTSSSVA
ncbi:hypothetical protein K438DRAFT_1775440 [Mycena galopus ATCC 62051]|nr:hypothetical protein K438DRAFT_1775440 [Mycena galopus ATCC 62051]